MYSYPDGPLREGGSLHRVPTGRTGRSQSRSGDFSHSQYGDDVHPEDETLANLGHTATNLVRQPTNVSHVPSNISRHPSQATHHTSSPAVPVPSHLSNVGASHLPTVGVEGHERPSDDEGRPLPVPSHPVTPGRRTNSIRSRHDTATPLPDDLSEVEREQERAHRLDEAERELHNAARSVLDADDQREQEYRLNEADRDRVFQEGEERRHREARERAELIWDEFHNRIAALPAPPPSTEPAVHQMANVTAETAGGDGVSVHSRETVAQQAASQHAIDILDTVKAERDEFAREREAAAREREILLEQATMDRLQQAEAQELRIKGLEDELAAVRAELASEKEQRMLIETEQRERESSALLERDEAVRNQLGDITNLVQEQCDVSERKSELADARWAEKQNRRSEKDQKMLDMEALVRKLAQDMEETRDLVLEAKVSRERGPDLDDVIKTLQEQNAEQRAVLTELSNGWREDCARYHQETIASVQSTANEQVTFNVQGYLDEFSKALASESKYGPGGEFDPEWKPAPGAPGGPPMDPPQPPPEDPPAPEIPPPAKPGWRKVTPKTPRVRKPKKEAAPAPPMPPPPPQAGPSNMMMHHAFRPDPRTSWNTWHRM
ncbi:hypothetical protein DXG03_006793 [Asterophora parasitica]|uniref:Uncharacterized protein n=1 Tax=Asterophora parasitica TaxID=117018 RepID=A0A9P7G925_9AGAR|nr:hypothetical protein DXG03_006793 [Asterophora parasitica]